MKLYFIEAEKNTSVSPTKEWFDTVTNKFFCPSLSAVTLAALTPADIDIRIIDEKVSAVDPRDIPDVAAISFKTMSSSRAYELADLYRSKGAKVILGGLHTSLLPEEAAGHSDSIVIGEAEEVWPAIVQDLKRGSLAKRYRQEALTDLSKIPVPRFDLLQNNSYYCHSIQTSRGCSLDCEFCPTREMFGGVFRMKPLDAIEKEIRTAMSIERKPIFFTDDIFGGGNQDFTLSLLSRIRKLKIEFFIISDFLVLNKKIVIQLAKSGCRYIALNLPGTYSREEVKAVKLIQLLGIEVWGYCMFGFRFHEKDVFKRAYDFMRTVGIRHVSLTVMAPYPNTRAGKELEAQGRILSHDWSRYDQAQVVFRPAKMTETELAEGFAWIKEKLSSLCRFRSDERVGPWKTLRAHCARSIAPFIPEPRKPTLRRATS